MKALLNRLISRTVCRGTPADVSRRLNALAADYVREASPADGLRMMMELDERLYAQHGRVAIEWEGGLHPKHRLTRYHDFFTDRLGAGDRVLDIGCGVGALAHDMAGIEGVTVTGIDIEGDRIEQARKNYHRPNLDFVHGDALKELPGGAYDVVVMSNVLEHIEHRVEFVLEVNARIRPRRWLVRVPVFERDWRVPLKRELELEWRLDKTHFTEFTVEQFHEEMGAARMAITHLEVRWSEIWSELCPEEA